MHIVNRATRKLGWQAYRQNDPTCAIPLSGKWGWLQAGNDVNMGMGEDSVKLRVGPSCDSGDPLYQGPFVNTRTVIINGSEKPVLLDDAYLGYVRMATGAPTAEGRAELTEMNGLADRALSGVRSILAGLPAQLAPVKALGTFLMMVLLDDKRRPDPPSIDEIKAALAEVVSNQTARDQSAAIMTTWHWLDGFVRLVNELKAHGREPSSFDVATFESSLDATLGPNSDFLKAMERLRSDDSARKLAFPAYLLGITLCVQLRTIAIGRSSLHRALVSADFAPLQSFLDASVKAMQKTKVDLNNDFQNLRRTYPIPPPELTPLIIGFNVKTIGVSTDVEAWDYVDRLTVRVKELLDDVNNDAAQVGAPPAVPA